MIHDLRTILVAVFLLGGVTPAALAAPPAAAPAPPDVAALASRTFVLGCVAHFGDYDGLRDRLRPGRDLYLPPLPAEAARPYLQGRDGEAWARPDAGVVLALLKPDDTCVVFVRKIGAEALRHRIEADLRAGLGTSHVIRSGGEQRKDSMLTRFIDLIPTGAYRADLARKWGREPTGTRVILTTSDRANPDLQAIITIGALAP